MLLAAGCPRCASAVKESGRRWECEEHGIITPLWRVRHAAYEAFAEHLVRARPLPTWVPWPLAPGWQLTDFGCVVAAGEDARATFVSSVGTNDLDGVVEVSVVTEEPGEGLGARCAGVTHTDPGAQISGPAPVRVRADGHPVPLWALSTSDHDETFDRSVFAGEVGGRWLWLVLRPASAALMLTDAWELRDVSGLGPELVALPFGDVPRAW